MNIERFLSQVFKDGSLEVRLPGGRTLMVGDGSTPGVAVAGSDPLTVGRILARPLAGGVSGARDGRAGRRGPPGGGTAGDGGSSGRGAGPGRPRALFAHRLP